MSCPSCHRSHRATNTTAGFTSSAESDVGISDQPPCLQEETELEELVLLGAAAGTGSELGVAALPLFVRACGRAGAQTFRGKGLMAPHLVGFCRHPSSIHTLYVHGTSRKKSQQQYLPLRWCFVLQDCQSKSDTCSASSDSQYKTQCKLLPVSQRDHHTGT